jgi:excisionase family DNA binding protein
LVRFANERNFSDGDPMMPDRVPQTAVSDLEQAGTETSTNGARASEAANPPDVLTIAEAATILGVSKATLRNWDRQGKLPAVRHPVNNYRLYPRDAVWELREGIDPYEAGGDVERTGRAERRFDVAFVAPLALAEKQIQQSYRPYIQVHKWFARRPGTLFRALLLAEFGDDRPLRETFTQSHDLRGRVVLDPFMGGGTPVLEANRVGMNVVGCDINPMATWIVRQELAAVDVRALRDRAEAILTRLEQELGHCYETACLKCGGAAVVKYYLWVKTVRCGGCEGTVELFPGYLIASNARHPNFVMFCRECRDLFEVPDLPDRGDQVVCTK